ncbi:class I SAM-dependent methyltransferase [Algoriphagus resistens]|uniref:class I SAM-dependent methyltransferase n=1 Tax=Algoriphagus resistens TaxID=1750590 RepID=UPI000716B0BC|nr:class I SAM-dependent methyltransferase [Algoriphagus resistens]
MKSRYTREMKMIASQLSHPSGKRGVELGEEMHEKNFFMIRSTIDLMQAGDRDSILELGHGSGAHVPYLMDQAADIHYIGLEISGTMKDMAEQNNSQTLGAATKFEIYDGLNILMDSGTFDKVLTVNTVYFWSHPARLAGEIFRVLRPGGRLVIAFADRAFMKKLPFTDFGFNLYDCSEVVRLMETAGFSLERITDQEEQVTSALGESLTRPFSVISFLKTWQNIEKVD